MKMIRKRITLSTFDYYKLRNKISEYIKNVYHSKIKPLSFLIVFVMMIENDKKHNLFADILLSSKEVWSNN